MLYYYKDFNFFYDIDERKLPMINNKPSFTLTDEMVNLVAEITEKLGRLEERNNLEKNIPLFLGSENRSISYTRKPEYHPFVMRSFLQAHNHITATTRETHDQFRSGNVSIFNGTNMTHMWADSKFIHNLVENLFEWAEHAKTHPLILSSIVHYEIASINPFEDGNELISRLWQTIILSKWKILFEHLPIENIVSKHQQNYYDAIALSKQDNSSNRFVIFMLKAINESLDEFNDIKITDKITDKLTPMEQKVLNPIIKYLLKHETIDNKNARALTDKSAESIKKYLNTFTKWGILIRIGENKGRKYKLNQETFKDQ